MFSTFLGAEVLIPYQSGAQGEEKKCAFILEDNIKKSKAKQTDEKKHDGL